MADLDLIARLFLSDSSIARHIALLNPTRFSRGQCPSPSPVSGNSKPLLSPENSQHGTDDNHGYLELRFSRKPKAHAEPGFVFGTEAEACDIILPSRIGISGRHFTITFENNDFANTQEYRLVLKDLNSKDGTIVKYNGNGGERRRGFRWILSGDVVDFFSISIIIEPRRPIVFRLAVLIPRIGLTGPLHEQVRRFLEPRPIDSLVRRLKVDASPNAPVAIFGHARKPKPILLNMGQLGDGGFAIVTHHYNVSTGLAFAIKRPYKKLIKHERETFRNQIELLSSLKHEHIIKCFSKPNGGALQLDLELMRGGTLESRRGEWSFGDKVEAFKQCLEALNYLHTLPLPIIHRGIKPANIFVDDTREGIWIKLADFGLARESNDADNILRTSSYFPPEFDSGTVASGHTVAVDIWSMGMTACQLFLSVPLYRKLGKKGCQELIDYVQRKADAKTPKISRLLRFVFDNMLVIKPGLRKSAGECLDALAMIHRNSDNDGWREEESEEAAGEDEDGNDDDDGAGGGNGGSGGSRDDHEDGTLTARPSSAVQARPTRILKRRGSSSPSSLNDRAVKRQSSRCTPETNIQPSGEMVSEASESRISETPGPLMRTD